MGVESRQNNIEEMYANVCDLAAKREDLLHDAINILDFFDRCDDFEQWMKQKSMAIQKENPTETVQDKKKKFEVSIPRLSEVAIWSAPRLGGFRKPVPVSERILLAFPELRH